MTNHLHTTELLAFKAAEVKKDHLVVPVLLASGEWAGLAATPSVWRQLASSVDHGLNELTSHPAPRKGGRE